MCVRPYRLGVAPIIDDDSKLVGVVNIVHSAVVACVQHRRIPHVPSGRKKAGSAQARVDDWILKDRHRALHAASRFVCFVDGTCTSIAMLR